ncbi:terminase large subunit [Lactovum odontotermitis]
MDKVTEYAQKVVDGEILAGKLLILACQRHLSDLNKQESEDFPFLFDTKILTGFLMFASRVPDPDTGEPQPLMDWQIFAMGSLVAWKDVETGGRRFKRGIISIARGQGKTYMADVLASYDYFVMSLRKHNQDILLSANTTQQTVKLFNYVKGTAERLLSTVLNPLSEEVSVRSMDIFNQRTKNQIIRMSAESGKYDSFHATTAIFDEAGDQRNREAFGKITSGQIKNENALFLMISTAYQNPNAPLREDIKMVETAIIADDGSLEDYFLAVWCQDDPDEVFDEELWIKSNPLLGLKSQRAKLLNGLISERNTLLKQGKLNDFLVKNMNIWLNAEQNAAFNLSDVEASVIPEFDMTGREVYIGFDNSMTSDDAALFFTFPYINSEAEKRWHLYQHSFIPWHKAGSIEAKENQDGINYRHMEELGFASITQHEKGLIDNDFIFTWLMDFVESNRLNVLEFDYDAAHSYAIIKAIDEATTWNMVGVRQGTISLNEPTKWLQDSFVEGRVTRLDDPMMQKSLMNAVIVSDNNGIKIDKNRATFKIDLVDAAIDSLYNAIYHFEDFSEGGQVSDYSRMSDKQVADFIMSGDFGF